MSHMFDFITGKRVGKKAELAASLEHALGHLGTELEENKRLRTALEFYAAAENSEWMMAAADEIERLRIALTAADKYVSEDMAENSPRSDGKDVKILAIIRAANVLAKTR